MIPLGVGVFVCANLLYARWRREDEPDPLRRAVAFCLGLPTTFLTFLLVETDTRRAWERRLRDEARDADPALIERDLEIELREVRRRQRVVSGPDGVHRGSE